MDFFNFLKINTKYLKDLIAANCSDNWHTHLQAVKKLLAFFEECDNINYLCYGSLYLELMNRLSFEHPKIFEEYIQEYFVGKTNSGSFNAIPSDMKLEQAI